MRWRILSQLKIHCKGNPPVSRQVFSQRTIQFAALFFAKSRKISKILSFQVMFNVHEDFTNSRKWKINFLFFELESREPNFAPRKTTVQISKFFWEILKVMSNIIVHLLFSIDGDYNNLRNSKNTLL